MSYAKQTWHDGPSGGTPIDAAALQHIEDGIKALEDSLPLSFPAALLPEFFGATGDGVADDTTPLTAWAAAGGGKLALSPGKVYLTTATLTVPDGSQLDGHGATLKAAAVLAGPILSSPSTLVRDGVVKNVTLACDNKAQTGLSLPCFAHYTISDVTVTDAAGHSVILGDTAAASTSYEAMVENLNIDRPSRSAVPAGSYGLWMRNAFDSEITQAVIVGADTGIRVDTDDNRFSNAHVWGYASALPSTCFDDNGNHNTWIGDVADSPSSIGFRIRKANSYTTLVGVRAYLNSFGPDNAVTCLKADTFPSVYSVIGYDFQGQDGTHRFAVDFDSDLTRTPIIIGTSTNVVTTNAPSGQLKLAGGNPLQVRGPNGQLFNVDGNNEEVDVVRGAKLKGFSDLYTTLKYLLDAATGDLTLAGGLTRGLTSKTANYAVGAHDSTVVAAGAGITLTLPSAVTAGAGREYTLKNHGSNAVTVAASAGAVEVTTIPPAGAYTYVSNGTDWLVI